MDYPSEVPQSVRITLALDPDEKFNYYVGEFEDALARIITDREEAPATAWGHIFLKGYPGEGGTFLVERLLRFGVGMDLSESGLDPRVAITSLAGPLSIPVVEGGAEGPLESLEVQLNYSALWADLVEKKIEGKPFEIVLADLKWLMEGEPDNGEVPLLFSLATRELVKPQMGIIKSITLEDVKVRLQPLTAPPEEDAQPQPFAAPPGENNPPFLLAAPAGAIALQAGPFQPCLASPRRGSPFNEVPVLRLRLSFINFSNMSGLSNPEIEAIAQAQFQKACEVWRGQAAIDFVVADPLAHQQTTAFNVTIGSSVTSIRALFRSDVFGVCLVDQIDSSTLGATIQNETGGGVCIHNGAASLCFLEIQAAADEPYLLAHELGHLFNLDHPVRTLASANWSDYLLSSTNSVMDPAQAGQIPSHNTLYNARVFTCSSPALPVLLKPRSRKAFLFPTGDFFYRDYELDPGADSSSPAPGGQTGQSPDLWNRRSQDYDENLPATHAHQDPVWGAINFLYLNVRSVDGVSNPVLVNLYLEDAALPGGLRLLQLAPGEAALPRRTTRSSVLVFPWQPSQSASGLSSPNCVYAVMSVECQPESNDTLFPQAQITFTDVDRNILNSNKVVQRDIVW